MKNKNFSFRKTPVAVARAYQRARDDRALPFYFFLLMLTMATLYLALLLVSFQ